MDISTKQRILDVLASGPATIADLAAALPDMKRPTVSKSVRRLHADGLLRIADWRRNLGTRGKVSPVWAMAIGLPDKRRPVIKNAGAEARRRYRRANLMRIAARSYMWRHGTLPTFYQMLYSPRKSS